MSWGSHPPLLGLPSHPAGRAHPPISQMRRLKLREGWCHQPGSKIHLLGWQLPELVAAVPTKPLGCDALGACR